MYKCELYTIKNKAQGEKLNTERLKPELEKEAIELLDAKELPRSAQKISDTVMKDIDKNEADLFILYGVPDTTDSKMFRKLFYALVRSLESDVKIEEKDVSAKLKISSLGDLGSGCKGWCFNFFGKRFLALPDAEAAGKEPSELIADAMNKSENVFDSRKDKYPEGVAFTNKKGEEVEASAERIIREPSAAKKKQGFFRSFIPWKGDTRSQIIRKVVVLLAIAAFIGALSYVLYFFKFGPEQQADRSSWIQSIAYNAEESDSPDNENKGPAQNWKELKKVNKEIVGWLKIPDTVIDYPVLEHKGDDRYYQYYIDHSYKKDSTEYGSIFMDYRCPDSTKSKNVIMHGHNMRDGSQFHSLLSYSPEGSLKGNLDYYRKHPVIIFNTPDGDAKYKIISVFKTSTYYDHGEFFNYMQGGFNSDAEFMNFVYNVRIRSMFDIPVTVNEDDQILTLSTCCYEFYQWRCVVVARKVRPGEDENVNVNLAKLNSSPLFPDVYYWSNGGERPDPGTFKTANAKGKISWYDGNGKLEGNEGLTATIASNPTQPPTEKPKPGAQQTEPPEVKYYLVTYRNIDGSQYAAYNVREGDPVPTPEGTPIMEEDENFTYKFDGWNKDIAGVDFNHLNASLEIYPTFISIPKQ